MKTAKQSWILASVLGHLLLSGCTTMEMLGEAGDEFKQGNIFWGTFMGAGALAFGPIVDVVTFGGVMDGSEATETWSTIATTAALASTDSEDGSKGVPNYSYPVLSTQTSQASNPVPSTQTSQASNYDNRSSSNAVQISSRSNGNSTQNTRVREPVAVHCVQRDSSSNSMADFLINTCSKKIWVTWFDQGNCHNGCGESVMPGGRDTITKGRGKWEYVACFEPATPRLAGSSSYKRWTPGNNFECVR